MSMPNPQKQAKESLIPVKRFQLVGILTTFYNRKCKPKTSLVGTKRNQRNHARAGPRVRLWRGNCLGRNARATINEAQLLFASSTHRSSLRFQFESSATNQLKRLCSQCSFSPSSIGSPVSPGLGFQGFNCKPCSDGSTERFAEGPACVLGMGTAVPPTEFLQSEYPEFFFNITNCSEKEALKAKFKRICDKSGIRKRHLFLTEEVLKANPGICTYMEPSLNVRHDIVVVQVPKLAAEAAVKAIKEWGGRKSDITHIVFATTSGVNMPGADHALAKLLGLKPSVKRVMMYQTGCFGGASVLRVAKDLAENNAGARVLAVCSEVTAVTYRAPSENHLDGLVGSALFGDGAGVYVVGADPKPASEKSLFEVHWAGETILPESDGAIDGHLTEAGLIFHLMKDVPGLISKNIEKFLTEARKCVGSPAWNEMFWAVHPGGPAILDQVEAKLKLSTDKMQGSRDVLSEFGNMSSSSVLFVLDQIRQRSVKMGASTLGEGSDFGFFIGFGPGLTLEVLVLRAATNTTA